MAISFKPRDPAFKPPARIAAGDFRRLVAACSEPKRASDALRARMVDARRFIKDSARD